MLPEDYDNAYGETSRLLSGDINYRGTEIPIHEYRNMVFARSLYNLDNEYNSTELYSLKNKAGVSDTIQNILNVIPQYNRIAVNTKIFRNAYDAYATESSPLSRIGIEMLGKQYAYNSAANLATRYLPTIDLSQVLSGSLKGIFTFKKEATITVKDNNGFFDFVGNVASKGLGIETYNIFSIYLN